MTHLSHIFFFLDVVGWSSNSGGFLIRQNDYEHTAGCIHVTLKIRREYIRVALMTTSTAKDGGNADFAGAYICLAVNNLENHMDTANVISYLWIISSLVR